MNRRRSFDYVILILIIALCCFGILMVFSASYYTYQHKAESTGMTLVTKHAGLVAGGLVLMLGVSFFDYHYFAKRPEWWRFRLSPLAVVVYLVSIAMLLWALLAGSELNGAGRWIRIGPISIQPSEIARVGLVIITAEQLATWQDQIVQNRNFRLFLQYLAPVALIGASICGLIFAGNALSMTIITGLTFLIMLWIAGVNSRILSITAVGALGFGAAAIGFSDFRRKRMMIFTNPWQDPQDGGYQLIQSLYALGNGGLFGVGIGNSRQKYQYLTYGDSDYILSIIAEEIGFVGVLVLLLAYGILIYRGMQTARRAPDRLGTYLAAGITCILTIQLVINVLVVTSVMPPTGVPLPFISSGGSSLIIFLASMGVLLNISSFRQEV